MPHRPLPMPHRPLALVAAAILAGTACSAYPSPPTTQREPVVDTLHGVVFTDDYRWLEEQDSPETRAWIAEQNAYAERVVGDTPLRQGLETRLRELMDVQGALFPRRAGDFEYFSFRRPGREVAAIYRRRAPDEPQRDPIDPGGDFEVVIDPLDIRADGTTSVSIRGFSPDGDLMMYAIRDGGQDEGEIRIRDLASGEDLPDRLPNFLYGSTFFDPEGTGFYYTPRSRETGPRVRHHTLGADMADDVELFGEGHGPEKFITTTQGGDGRYLVYTVRHGWARADVYLHDLHEGGGPEPLIVGAPARFEPRFVRGELYLLTNVDAPNNRVMAVDLNRTDPSSWREVIAETDEPLTGYQIIGERIYASYLADVSTRLLVYDLDGTQTAEIPLPEHHTATLRPWGEGAGLLTLSSYITPPMLCASIWRQWRPSHGLRRPCPLTATATRCGRFGTPLRTARSRPCMLCIGGGKSPMGMRRHCCTGTAASTPARPRASTRALRRGWNGEACMRWRRCGAAASSARPGTGRECSRTSPMCLTTSLRRQSG